MFKGFRKVIFSTFLLTLVGACKPAATPVPTPLRTTVLPAPVTSLPPTSTGLPPTATSILPTSTRLLPTPSVTPPVGADILIGMPISLDTAARVERLHTLEGHRDKVYSVAFSPDSRFLASASFDGTVKLWDMAVWQIIREFKHSADYGLEVFFLADNVHISSDSGMVWNIDSGETEQLLSDSHRVTFSPDGVWMAANGRDSLTIEVWRVGNRQLQWETPTNHVGHIYSLAFSADGRLLASGSSMGATDTSDYTVKVWDVATGQEVFTLKGHRGDVHALAFSPDGKLLASASIDTTVKVWDLQTGKLLRTLNNKDGMYDVTFSPDGSLLATAVCDRTVKLWDVVSGRLVRTLIHGDEVMSVAFSPDGNLLASGAYDNKIYLWGIIR
jgi:WD40 repeat protein